MQENIIELLTLEGLIVSRYGTKTNFAKKINWSKQVLNNKLMNRDKLTLKDAELFAEALELPVTYQTIQFFLK